MGIEKSKEGRKIASHMGLATARILKQGGITSTIEDGTEKSPCSEVLGE